MSHSVVRLVVDGESFDVVQRPGSTGQYDFAWVSGRNRGYGFTSRSSDGGSMTKDQMREAIRAFLDQVDRKTGYID